MTATASTCSIDLFTDTALEDPYPLYAALRAMGPAVYLTRHQAWAVTGYDDVRAALNDPETFSSVDGIALTDEANRTILAGTVLASDGAEHARLRRPLSRQLNPRAMRDVAEWVQAVADQLVSDYVGRGRFDAAELVTQLVGDVVMHLMGLPESTRDEIISKAAATFDCFGPDNDRYARAAPAAAAMVAYLNEEVTRDSVRPGSWMDALYQAADAGQIAEEDVKPLMSAYTAAGLDSTIYGILSTLHLLATHPEQWKTLRTGLADGQDAFAEAIRLEAPIQGFGRRVTRDTTISGVPIPKGDQVWLLYGATGRDPLKWGPRADVFDIRRPHTCDHLSLGSGPHLCAGQHLAVLEASSLLQALASRCTRLELAGTPPVRAVNNTLRGWRSLPLQVSADRRRTLL